MTKYKYNKKRNSPSIFFHLHTAHKIDKAIHFHNHSQLNIIFCFPCDQLNVNEQIIYQIQQNVNFWFLMSYNNFIGGAIIIDAIEIYPYRLYGITPTD